MAPTDGTKKKPAQPGVARAFQRVGLGWLMGLHPTCAKNLRNPLSPLNLFLASRLKMQSKWMTQVDDIHPTY